MKFILTILLMLSSIVSFSQEYPRLEIDSLGNKVVVFTLEQAQKIDNNLDILKLLELQGFQCDSLSTSYLKVIDNFGKQVSLLELNVTKLKEKVMDKDAQISNLQSQLVNSESINRLCEEQKANDKEEISILKKEIRRQKLQKFGGFIVGLAAVVGSVFLLVVSL